MRNSTDELKLFPSKRRMIMLIVGSAVFTVGGISMITSGDPMGWCVALFFGLCMVVGIVNVLPNASHLHLTRDGFEVKSLFKARTFSWDEVYDFRVYDASDTSKLVGFDLADSHPMGQTMRKVNSAVAGVHDCLPENYGMKAEALAHLMNEWKEKS